MDAQDIFNLWLKRITEGDRHLAVSNVGHVGLQQKYVLLFLSFIKQHKDFSGKKIGVVSFHIEQGLYKEYFSNYSSMNNDFKVINTISGDFINWQYMIYKNVPNEMLEGYDLLLWDLPDLNFINVNSQALKRFFVMFDCMFILSTRQKGIDNIEHVDRINRYYSNHGLKLPKLISEEKEGEVVRPKKITDVLRRIAGL